MNKLPQAPASYSPQDESQHRSIVEQALKNMRSANEDVEIKRNQRMIMRSPNGTRWSVTIDDTGVISTAAL